MAGFHTQTVEIGGMKGQDCIQRIAKELGALPGVRVSGVEVGRAQVLAESHCAPAIRESLEHLGYTLEGIRAEG